MIYAPGQKTKVYQIMPSLMAATDVIGCTNWVLINRISGKTSKEIIGSNLRNVWVEYVDGPVDGFNGLYHSVNDAIDYFRQAGYAIPSEIVPEGGFRNGHHPNQKSSQQDEETCAIICTNTGTVVAAFRSQVAVADELWGVDLSTFASSILNPRKHLTRELHHNLKGPDGKPCNLSSCYLRRLSKEDASKHENLIELSGNEKRQALKKAGKWHDDAKQVLTCGCGTTHGTVASVRTHVARFKNDKCKKGYYENLGVKAFSGKKYEFLRNK